jgi:hypothetical protein
MYLFEIQEELKVVLLTKEVHRRPIVESWHPHLRPHHPLLLFTHLTGELLLFPFSFLNFIQVIELLSLHLLGPLINDSPNFITYDGSKRHSSKFLFFLIALREGVLVN